METQSFNSMNLKKELLDAIEEKGFENPTPIQKRAIPPALLGRDIMGQAQTGTGKTAAFGLPVLNNIKKDGGLQALILCPTRELAVQVAEEMSTMGKRLNIFTLAVYGGQSIDVQFRALRKRPEVIVGTPGRLLDHFNRRTINLKDLNHVVLDEADEMLDMGFFPDITKILEQCPEKRQTFLFSATLEHEIRDLGMRFMKDPEVILVEPKDIIVPLITQSYYDVNPGRKIESLCRIMDVEQPQVALIFSRTKKGADELSRALEVRGYAASALHGDMTQRERDNVMDRFRKGTIEILVATDLAARGLDIDHVTHVVNFDIPEDPDSYIHRIGRTGRAGRDGTAITLVEPRQIKHLRYIERLIKQKIKRVVLPSLEDAIERRQERLIKQVEDMAEGITASHYEMANKLLEKYEPKEIVASFIKLLDDETPNLEMAKIEPTRSDETVNVELAMGRFQGVHAKSLVQYIASNTPLAPNQVGDIEIHQNNTFIEVPMFLVDDVYDALKRYEMNKKGQNRQRTNRTRRKPPAR